MKPVDTKERAGAVAMALGITFSIVWALATELSPAAKLVAPKSCS